MIFNQAGLALSCDSQATAGLFDETVNAYLGFSLDTGKHVKALLTAEPQMPMANVLMGYFYQLMGSRNLVPRAQKSLAAARQHGQSATARERTHMDALDAWARDDLRGATAHWESILLEQPRDILAIKLAHFGHFYLGDPLNIRDSLARVLPHWSDQDSGYGFLLSMYAFGLEETGDYGKAEAQGRRAIDLNRHDPWGVHAVAHVLEMQERYAEGIEWIDELEEAWSTANNFRYHLAWHRALYYLDRDEPERALQLYDETTWDPDSREYLDLCNDVALLARLDLAGIDTGTRWNAVADVLSQHSQVHIMNFIDAHYTLGLTAGGKSAAAEQMMASLESELSENKNPHDSYLEVAARVGLALSTAMIAYANGRFDRAVELMLPIRYDIQLIGGSHAQRDLFAQLLIDAAIKADRLRVARGLLAERKALKPNNAATERLQTRVLAALA